MFVIHSKLWIKTKFIILFLHNVTFFRYAFIKFLTVEEAMEAYKSALNMQIASRSIILRFRRHKGPVGPPGENQTEQLVNALLCFVLGPTQIYYSSVGILSLFLNKMSD